MKQHETITLQRFQAALSAVIPFPNHLQESIRNGNQKVTINSIYADLNQGISAEWRFPEGFDASKKHPVIICAHPIGSCKEQTAGNVYAEALTRAGYVTIAFDARYQGESGGEPRTAPFGNPSDRVADFSIVVDYLMTQDFVDENRIGVLGVCGSGYAVAASMIERRIKATVTVVAGNYGQLFRETFADFDPLATLEKMAAQRTAEVRGAALLVPELLPKDVETAKQVSNNDYDVVQATDYYRNRIPMANAPVSSVFSRNAQGVSWDVLDHAEQLLTNPIMVVIGDKMGAFGSHRFGYDISRRAGAGIRLFRSSASIFNRV